MSPRAAGFQVGGRRAKLYPLHLSRLSTAHAGMTATDAVSRPWVALARNLLGQPRLDMERVAERAGFCLPGTCVERGGGFTRRRQRRRRV
jgi:transcriptional regulator GlxA family with amidase domain